MLSIFALRPLTVIVTSAIAAGSSFAAAPEAEKLFENYIKAIGGETAVRAIKTKYYDGTMENKKAKAVSRITSWQKAPNQSYTEIETLGASMFVQGFDGTEAWSMDPKNGVRVLEGTEAAAVADGALFYGDLEWKTRYSEVKTLGDTTFESKPAIEVSAKTAKGGMRSIFFDPKTGLEMGVKEMIPGAAGSDGKPAQQLLTTTFDEYKEIQGVKTVVKFTQKVGDVDVVSTFKTVDVNTQFDTKFSKPEVEKKTAPSATDTKKDEKKDEKKDAKK